MEIFYMILTLAVQKLGLEKGICAIYLLLKL